MIDRIFHSSLSKSKHQHYFNDSVFYSSQYKNKFTLIFHLFLYFVWFLHYHFNATHWTERAAKTHSIYIVHIYAKSLHLDDIELSRMWNENKSKCWMLVSDLHRTRRHTITIFECLFFSGWGWALRIYDD